MTGGHGPHVTYADGFWLHRGGAWRVDLASGPRVLGRTARARAEIARLAPRRRFDAVLRPACERSAEADVLVPVDGLSTPLCVDRAPGSSADPAVIAAQLRRLVSPPRRPPRWSRPFRGSPPTSRRPDGNRSSPSRVDSTRLPRIGGGAVQREAS